MPHKQILVGIIAKTGIDMIMKISWILALLIFFSSCLPSQKEKNFFQSGEWVDLSYSFDEQTIYWPTSLAFKLDTVFAGNSPQGFYYTAFNFSGAEHGGTHLDAPVHFSRGKLTNDEIPLEQLSGWAVVVDVSQKALNDRDYQVTAEDLIEWERINGRIREGSIILLKTGFGRFWPNRKKYLGTELLGNEGVASLHFPGLHPDGARWLVNKRKIKAVGIDTPSIDFGQSKLFRSHQNLFFENIPVFENVANLDKLPAIGAWVIALPMKIKGGSGGPLRIVAWIPLETFKYDTH